MLMLNLMFTRKFSSTIIQQLTIDKKQPKTPYRLVLFRSPINIIVDTHNNIMCMYVHVHCKFCLFILLEIITHVHVCPF